MKFEKIYKNITGISCPIFGLQWNAPVLECDEAKKLIIFLEDKRVLFNPSKMEDYRHCLSSVNCMREEMTKYLQKIPEKTLLEQSLRKMRNACLRFMDNTENKNYLKMLKPIQKSILDRELIKLRQKIGLAIAEVSIAYGIDVDDNLASILPFNNMSNQI